MLTVTAWTNQETIFEISFYFKTSYEKIQHRKQKIVQMPLLTTTMFFMFFITSRELIQNPVKHLRWNVLQNFCVLPFAKNC